MQSILRPMKYDHCLFILAFKAILCRSVTDVPDPYLSDYVVVANHLLSTETSMLTLCSDLISMCASYMVPVSMRAKDVFNIRWIKSKFTHTIKEMIHELTIERVENDEPFAGFQDIG